MDNLEIIPGARELDCETLPKLELGPPTLEMIYREREQREKKKNGGLTNAEYLEETRRKFGYPEHQEIPVNDDLLTGIGVNWYLTMNHLLPFNRNAHKERLHTSDSNPWFRRELEMVTDNPAFTYETLDIRPYRVRAGILADKDEKVKKHKEEKSKNTKNLLKRLLEMQSPIIDC